MQRRATGWAGARPGRGPRGGRRDGARAAALCLAAALAAAPGARAAEHYERLAAIVAELEAPTAVAVGADGTVCVAEASRNRVVVLDAAGARRGTIEPLARPISVAIDADGRILVGCAGRGSVEVFDAALAPLRRLGAGEGEFGQPSGIAVAGDGTVFVADSRRNAVLRYGPDGSPRGAFGDPGAGAFDFPTALALDAAGEALVVAELPRAAGSVGARVRLFSTAGAPLRSLGGYGLGEGRFVRPLGVAVDGAGRVYASDAYQHVVQVFGRDGAWLTAIHDDAHPLRTPVGIALDRGGGRLLAASLTAGRVDVFALRWPPRLERLAVATAGAGSGTVTSSPPGISCPGTCAAEFSATATVALAARPGPGSVLASWEGDCAGSGECSLAMDGPRAVTARFERGPAPVAGDFDGDGRSDVLLVDRTRGTVAVRLVGPGLRTTEAVVGSVPRGLAWALGDADADGREDVLWHDPATGALALWLMDGARVAERREPAGRIRRPWSLEAVADFDGDRRADLLVRNRRTGAVGLRSLDGPAAPLRRTIGRMAAPRWTVAAAADFNGDGATDILWRSRRGRVVVWTMSGAARSGRIPLGTAPGAGRRLAGAGDFDGDGATDILWRRGATGGFTLWRLRAGSVRAEFPLVLADGGRWPLRGIGDYDRDGVADLLLAAPSGDGLRACLGDGAAAARCAPLTPAGP